MNNTKPIHLRSDEYNSYIEECKEKYAVQTGELTLKEKHIIDRCGLDYGLTIDEKLKAANYEEPTLDHNLILRIKGPFTLPEQSSFHSEHGPLRIRPYVIHESATADRLQEIAESLFAKELVKSVVPIDTEYLYDALRETAFNISMEEIVKLGAGFQIIQVEFDKDGHFKAIELDESNY